MRQPTFLPWPAHAGAWSVSLALLVSAACGARTEVGRDRAEVDASVEGILCGRDGLCEFACAADPDCSERVDADVDAHPCHPEEQAVCARPSCDDGATAAAQLTNWSLDCVQAASSPRFSHMQAVRVCEGIGAGYRLPTKGEVFAIERNPRICVGRLPMDWSTWTSTCSGVSEAWSFAVGYSDVNGDGMAVQSDEISPMKVFCVRPR